MKNLQSGSYLLFHLQVVLTVAGGDVEGAEFAQTTSDAYSEVVHWKRNIFMVPSGAEGKEFVVEMARLFQSYADGSAMEGLVITAVMTMPV